MTYLSNDLNNIKVKHLQMKFTQASPVEYFLFFVKEFNFLCKGIFVPITLLDDNTHSEIDKMLIKGEYLDKKWKDPETKEYDDIMNIIMKWNLLVEDSPGALIMVFGINDDEFEIFDQLEKVPDYYKHSQHYYEHYDEKHGSDPLEIYESLKQLTNYKGVNCKIVGSIYNRW